MSVGVSTFPGRDAVSASIGVVYSCVGFVSTFLTKYDLTDYFKRGVH